MRPRSDKRVLAFAAAGSISAATIAALVSTPAFDPIATGRHSTSDAESALAAAGAEVPPRALARPSGGTMAAAAAETGSPAPQYGRRRRAAPRFPDPNAPIDGDFVFARVLYQSTRYEPLGQGWFTDYPEGDKNFMSRFDEFTTAHVRRTSFGTPDHVVVTLHDEELFKYPFIFMSDVGTVGFDSVEVERLREYLLKGGFLWVDDFWGWQAWDQWRREIGRVLPPEEYPILDVPPEHPLRQMLYDVAEIPQIPSIQWWRRSGRVTTSERGADSATPHLRSISDSSGRVLVLMSHNTDIADGWERENEDFEFFDRFSFPAYAVGINVGVFVMSH